MQSCLEVGFGRQLHVPLQVGQAPHGGHDSLKPSSSDKAVQESYNQAGTPAALFEFEQLCGQQVPCCSCTMALTMLQALGSASMHV